MRFKSSTMPLRQIGQELGVDVVIEGSVQRDGDHVWVTAQLIDARTDTHVWAHTYDARLADVLNLQSTLARTIAEQVQVQLSARETRQLSAPLAVNPAAHDEVLMGYTFRWKGGAGDLHTAIEHYERAARLDSQYAPAYAGMSLAWIFLNEPGAIASARVAAMRALELNPDLPEAHAALAAVKYREWDWEGGDAESLVAIEGNTGALDGCFCYSITHAATGRLPEALAVADQTILRNPIAGAAHQARGTALFYARRYDEAAAAFRKGLEVDPSYIINTILLAAVYGVSGHADEAVALVEGSPLRNSMVHAVAYAHAGRRADALRVFKMNTGKGSVNEAEVLARVQLALGDNEAGLQSLERSVDAHEMRVFFLIDPAFDPVRDHPRFRALVARMKFPPQYAAFESSLPKFRAANATR
jgi:tetratricopeptide (TPR) repeat protein